jgi:hypothetical protein
MVIFPKLNHLQSYFRSSSGECHTRPNLDGPWALVHVFSATLLVEQGWSQLISLCPPAIPPRVNPFTWSKDESVSRVLCVRVLAPTEGLGGAALVRQVLQQGTILDPQIGRRIHHLGGPNLYKSCVPCPCTYLRALGLTITILTTQSTTSGTPLVSLLV